MADSRSMSSSGRPFMIGVGGGTASGKSSVCSKIIEAVTCATIKAGGSECGPQSIALLSQDSFYRKLSSSESVLAAKGKFNFDHPDAFDLNQMLQCLTAIADGQPTSIPIYDPVHNALVENERQSVVKVDVVIVEGILVLYCPKIRQLFDLKLFVDADADTRLARRVRRDVEERGRELQRVLVQYMSMVKPSFEEFVLPTKKFADIIIPRGAENNVATTLIEEVITRELLEPRGKEKSCSKSKVVVGKSNNKLLLLQQRGEQCDDNNNRLQQIPH